MIDFQSLSDEELKVLTAEWYLRHRQALDVWQHLRDERLRRLVEQSEQLYFTEWGVVNNTQEDT